jgi:anti-sigma factor ChrR (cupin superfamily)
LEFLQVHKGLLKALLKDILGVLAVSSDTHDGEQHHSPVVFNEKSKCLVVTGAGGSH